MSTTNKRMFNILTINALGLVYSTRINIDCKSDEPIFNIDLSIGYPSYVTEEVREDNALFYQICANNCKYANKPERATTSDTNLLTNCDPGSCVSETNCLKNKIIIMDFNNIFEEMSRMKYSTEDAVNAIKNDSKELSWGTILSLLLDSKNGISITFADNTHIQTKSPNNTFKFVPFDKSASMGKCSRMTFIESSIRDDIDERLRLGIDFNKIPLSLSKYYSYRGLYLTSGIRIDKEIDHFELNEKTVIIVPDLKVTPKDDYNGCPLVYTQKNFPDANSGEKYEFEVKNEEIEVTAFDGEGFVSPDYAGYIREKLKNTANSFQVRMPFIKGMLHTVDFHKFLSEKHLKANDSAFYNSLKEEELIRNKKPENKDPIILDFLGIKRNLNEAKIIINQSMFKCHGWLTTYYENEGKELISNEYNDDAMKFFFAKMQEYDHSLYVSGSDASFAPNGYERLNYQFIDTMNLSDEDMKKLVDKHIEIQKEQLSFFLHPDKIDQNAIDRSSPYIAAAVYNPLFFNEPRLKNEVTQWLRKNRIDLGKGTLSTTGEHRFLSGDLAAYLWYILALCNNSNNNSVKIDIKYFENKGLLKGSFYMPQKECDPLKLNSEDYYALFRSPHLSRNEECLLQAYIPNGSDIKENASITSVSPKPSLENNSDIYIKYLSKLTGILMVPIGSLAALIMGGADFDGDHCKLFTDETICNAVIKGGYDENFKRKLPVVNIPTAKSEEVYLGDEKKFKELIIHTFSSYTGLISNLSVTFGDKEYQYSEMNNDTICQANLNFSNQESLCAMTTAVCGLEIDAGKNSGHPMANINDLLQKRNDYSENGADFIKFKNAMKLIHGKGQYSIEIENKNGDCFYNLKLDKSSLCQIKANIDSGNSIMKLPDFFYELYEDSKKNKTIMDDQTLKNENLLPNQISPQYYYNFDDPKNVSHQPTYDPTLLANVKSLIQSYIELRKDIIKARSQKEKNDSYSKLFKLLDLKYDTVQSYLKYYEGDTGKPNEYGTKKALKTSDKTVFEVLKNIFFKMNNFFTDKEKVYTALCEVSKNWLLCPPNKRSNRLMEITKISSFTLEEEALLCDFSFDGYYILYYFLETIYNQRLNMLTESERLRNIANNREKRSAYYDELLKAYNKQLPIRTATDQRTSENSQEDSDEVTTYDNDSSTEFELETEPDNNIIEEYIFDYYNRSSSPVSNWRDLLNNLTYNKLLDIISQNTKSRTIDTTCVHMALQYAHKARSNNIDKNGTFFWDVIPRCVILDHINQIRVPEYNREKKVNKKC